MSPKEVKWEVELSRQTEKEKNKLPIPIRDQFFFLVKAIEILGPYRSEWKNYGPLRRKPGIPDDAYHCHLKKGKPTYVACWYITNKKERKIEVFYVGSHEGAPY